MPAKSGTKPIDHGHMGPGYSRRRKLPRARRLARLLRERRGLTREQVAGRLGVRLEAIAEMEDWGDIRCVGWDVSSGDGGLIKAQEVIDRYVDLLKPMAPEDERTLRDDRFDELVQAMLAYEELMEATGWEPLNRPASAARKSPARSTTRRRKQRSSRPRLSPLDAIGAPSPRVCQVGEDGPPKAAARIRIQVVAEIEGQEPQTVDAATLDKPLTAPRDLGLSLAECKRILARVQEHVIGAQVDAYMRSHSQCTRCGARLGGKGHRRLRHRTLLGTVKVRSPRLRRCKCRTDGPASFSPLSVVIPERTSPELRMMEAKWSSIVSYELAGRLLKDFLPVDERLSPSTVRAHTLETGTRLDRELAGQHHPVPRGRSRRKPRRKRAGRQHVLGVDGGFLRRWHERGSSFEAIVGKSVPGEGPAKCFAAVQSVDDAQVNRVRAVLKSQGVSDARHVRFLSDGAPSLHELHAGAVPESEHVLDWFHLGKRFTAIERQIQGLDRREGCTGTHDKLGEIVESGHWRLWHGRVDGSLQRIEEAQNHVRKLGPDHPKRGKLAHALSDLHRYVDNNGCIIPNYGKEYKAGRAISTAFAESIVNSILDKRFSKSQQMQWTPRGAHMLLQVRTELANGALGAAFDRWYGAARDPLLRAACPLVNANEDKRSARGATCAA